ncbi:MAG: hypothetical protein RR632_07635, partial [Christensenella sp.]
MESLTQSESLSGESAGTDTHLPLENSNGGEGDKLNMRSPSASTNLERSKSSSPNTIINQKDGSVNGKAENSVRDRIAAEQAATKAAAERESAEGIRDYRLLEEQDNDTIKEKGVEDNANRPRERIVRDTTGDVRGRDGGGVLGGRNGESGQRTNSYERRSVRAQNSGTEYRFEEEVGTTELKSSVDEVSYTYGTKGYIVAPNSTIEIVSKNKIIKKVVPPGGAFISIEDGIAFYASDAKNDVAFHENYHQLSQRMGRKATVFEKKLKSGANVRNSAIMKFRLKVENEYGTRRANKHFANELAAEMFRQLKIKGEAETIRFFAPMFDDVAELTQFVHMLADIDAQYLEQLEQNRGNNAAFKDKTTGLSIRRMADITDGEQEVGAERETTERMAHKDAPLKPKPEDENHGITGYDQAHGDTSNEIYNE